MDRFRLYVAGVGLETSSHLRAPKNSPMRQMPRDGGLISLKLFEGTKSLHHHHQSVIGRDRGHGVGRLYSCEHVFAA